MIGRLFAADPELVESHRASHREMRVVEIRAAEGGADAKDLGLELRIAGSGAVGAVGLRSLCMRLSFLQRKVSGLSRSTASSRLLQPSHTLWRDNRADLSLVTIDH